MKGDDKNSGKILTELRKRIWGGGKLQNIFKESLSEVYVYESKRTRAAVFWQSPNQL